METCSPRPGERRRYLAEDMYDVTTELLQDGNATRYRVFSDGIALSYGDALDLLRNDRDFRSYLTDQLKQSTYSAFRWETPHIQIKTRSRL